MVTEMELAEMAKEAYDKIVKSKVRNMSRDAVRDKFTIDQWYENLPDFNKIYRETIKQHYRVAVHADINEFPYEVLRTKAPNQSPDEWEYQRGLYEPYTNSTWGQARNRTKLIANKQNYSINWKDDEQRKYFYDDYPFYHSIESYFFNIVREAKCDYPNQVLLIKPSYIPGEWVEEEWIPDQSVMIEPICVIIEEKNVVKFRDNSHLLIIEEWDIDEMVFNYYDRNNIYEIRQVKGTSTFTSRLIYTHNLGYLPARKLGGKPIICDGELLYLSYFASAIADLNDVIRLSSNLMMSSCSMLFPVRIALVDKCTYRNGDNEPCIDGRIFTNGAFTTCPSCNGTGRKNSHSPTGVYEIMQPDGLDQQNTLAMSPPVQFVGPSTDIYTKVEESIQKKKESAFQFLYPRKGAMKTAAESDNEREDFQSFLIQFSNEFYDLMYFAFCAIGQMRYGLEAFEKPQINKPNTFEFKTNAEITEEIGQSRKDSLPSSYTMQLIKEAATSRFGSQPEVDKYIDFCIKVDSIWNMDDATVRANVNVTVSVEDAVIHDRITYLIAKCEWENEDFWDLDFDKQEELIREKAREIAAVIAPPSNFNFS